MDLYWLDQVPEHPRAKVTHAYLFVGVVPEPVAYVYQSNKGKMWGSTIDLPCTSVKKRWLPKEDMQAEVEKAVGDWFNLANTSRPAQEYQEPLQPKNSEVS